MIKLPSSVDEIAVTTLFKILDGEMEADSGTFKWGVTITMLTSLKITLNSSMTVTYH